MVNPKKILIFPVVARGPYLININRDKQRLHQFRRLLHIDSIGLTMRKKKVEMDSQIAKPTKVDSCRAFDIWDQLGHRLSKMPYGDTL
jgi:hypothetical protein